MPPINIKWSTEVTGRKLIDINSSGKVKMSNTKLSLEVTERQLISTSLSTEVMGLQQIGAKLFTEVRDRQIINTKSSIKVIGHLMIYAKSSMGRQMINTESSIYTMGPQIINTKSSTEVNGRQWSIQSHPLKSRGLYITSTKSFIHWSDGAPHYWWNRYKLKLLNVEWSMYNRRLNQMVDTKASVEVIGPQMIGTMNSQGAESLVRE